MLGCSQNTMQKLKRDRIITTTMLSFLQNSPFLFGAFFLKGTEDTIQVCFANTFGYNQLGGFIIELSCV